MMNCYQPEPNIYYEELDRYYPINTLNIHYDLLLKNKSWDSR